MSSSSSGGEGLAFQLTRVERELKAVKNSAGTVLNLNYCNLREIPEELLRCEYCEKYLQKLYMKRNCITTLNADVNKFQALTILYLHSNSLTELPHVVSSLSSLSSLDVSSNNITTLTPSFSCMKNLATLNVSNNKVVHLPDELWRAPSLQCLNASNNDLRRLSVEIIHCQSLHTLQLDNNKLTSLPLQVTKLVNLEHLSLSGNQLSALPNDFSLCPKLRQLCADSNQNIVQIPVSLAPLSWWGVLGVAGCDVLIVEREIAIVKVVHKCKAILPLVELAARSLHCTLRDTLHDNVTLWHSSDLCTRLHLPKGLGVWLVPRGQCFRCRQPYFYSYSLLKMSGAQYVALTRGVCKPPNMTLAVDFCSQACLAHSYDS